MEQQERDQADAADEDFHLLDGVDVTEESNNSTVLQLLSNLNANMSAMSKSLKRLHDNSSPHIDGAHTAKNSAKKAKLANVDDSHNVSESCESDSDMLLSNERTVENSTNKQDGSDLDHTKDDDDALLDEIAKSLDGAESTGEAVHSKLASIANKRWLNKLSDEQLREKFDKHLRPANCEHVVVPRVNPEIWAKLPTVVKGADLKLSHIQSALCKAAYIALKTTDMLLHGKSKPDAMSVDNLARLNTRLGTGEPNEP